MPRMSGYVLAAKLQAGPETKGVLMFAVTGHGMLVDHVNTQQAGFAQHLLKPVDLDELKSLLAKIQYRALWVTQD